MKTHPRRPLPPTRNFRLLGLGLLAGLLSTILFLIIK